MAFRAMKSGFGLLYYISRKAILISTKAIQYHCLLKYNIVYNFASIYDPEFFKIQLESVKFSLIFGNNF